MMLDGLPWYVRILAMLAEGAFIAFCSSFGVAIALYHVTGVWFSPLTAFFGWQ